MGGKHWRQLVVGTSLLNRRRLRSSEEWNTWRSSTSHFASKEHFDFSMKNRGGEAATVTKNDVAWRRPRTGSVRLVTVNQDQILER